MQALLIDADAVAVQKLAQDFTDGGFQVETATESEAALDSLICKRYDVLILSYSIHDLSGQRLYNRLNEAGLPTPILLTARREETINEDDIVSVTKDAVFFHPIEPQELINWSKAIIDFTNIFVGFMDFPTITRKKSSSSEKENLEKSSKEINLTLHEKKLLGLLLKNRGRTVQKSEILERVWGSEEEEVFTNVVEVYITRLRRKLGAQGKNLLTIRGVGYRFEI